MTDPVRPRHLLLTFLVTEDGEQGHPMDTITTRVDIRPDGEADSASIDRLTERIRRAVHRKAREEGSHGLAHSTTRRDGG